jgi:hypothetical protein
MRSSPIGMSGGGGSCHASARISFQLRGNCGWWATLDIYASSAQPDPGARGAPSPGRRSCRLRISLASFPVAPGDNLSQGLFIGAVPSLGYEDTI